MVVDHEFSLTQHIKFSRRYDLLKFTNILDDGDRDVGVELSKLFTTGFSSGHFSDVLLLAVEVSS